MPEKKKVAKKKVAKKTSAKNQGATKKTAKKTTPSKKNPKVKNSKVKNSKPAAKTSKIQKPKPSGITELARFLTGEATLDKEKKHLEELKLKAIENQKEAVRKGIQNDQVVLEEDHTYSPDNIRSTGGAPKKIVQRIDLFSWDAPIRVKFFFEMKTFMMIVSLSLVFILYLAVLGHYGLMFVIIALLFFLYVAGTTEPLVVTHKITTRGIDTLDKLYEWHLLNDFWFTRKNDEIMLLVESKLRVPSKLIMIVDKKDMVPIFLLLQDKLLYKDGRMLGKIDELTFGEYVKLEEL